MQHLILLVNYRKLTASLNRSHDFTQLNEHNLNDCIDAMNYHLKGHIHSFALTTAPLKL